MDLDTHTSLKAKVKLLQEGVGEVYALELFQKQILKCTQVPESNGQEVEIEIDPKQAVCIIQAQKEMMKNLKGNMADDWWALYSGNVIWVRLSREPGKNMLVCVVGLVLCLDKESQGLSINVHLPHETIENVQIYDLPLAPPAWTDPLQLRCIVNWNGGKFENNAKEQLYPSLMLEMIKNRANEDGIWKVGQVTCDLIDYRVWHLLDIQCKNAFTYLELPFPGGYVPIGVSQMLMISGRVPEEYANDVLDRTLQKFKGGCMSRCVDNDDESCEDDDGEEMDEVQVKVKIEPCTPEPARNVVEEAPNDRKMPELIVFGNKTRPRQKVDKKETICDVTVFDDDVPYKSKCGNQVGMFGVIRMPPYQHNTQTHFPLFSYGIMPSFTETQAGAGLFDHASSCQVSGPYSAYYPASMQTSAAWSPRFLNMGAAGFSMIPYGAYASRQGGVVPCHIPPGMVWGQIPPGMVRGGGGYASTAWNYSTGTQTSAASPVVDHTKFSTQTPASQCVPRNLGDVDLFMRLFCDIILQDIGCDAYRNEVDEDIGLVVSLWAYLKSDCVDKRGYFSRGDCEDLTQKFLQTLFTVWHKVRDILRFVEPNIKISAHMIRCTFYNENETKNIYHTLAALLCQDANQNTCELRLVECTCSQIITDEPSKEFAKCINKQYASAHYQCIQWLDKFVVLEFSCGKLRHGGRSYYPYKKQAVYIERDKDWKRLENLLQWSKDNTTEMVLVLMDFKQVLRWAGKNEMMPCRKMVNNAERWIKYVQDVETVAETAGRKYYDENTKDNKEFARKWVRERKRKEEAMF